MKILAVGDIHVKTSNFDIIDQLIVFMETKIKDTNPDNVVLLGDILDYHEKVITQCLNKACELIDRISKLKHVYILVGNHDYTSNTQFLTKNHWMNTLKYCSNVTIVDTVIVKHGITFCPYVFPGRFIEALNTNPKSLQSSLIFCHQEFRGCDLGIVKSIDGDDPSIIKSKIISGHIHDNQQVGDNVFYVGAPFQHSFSEKEKRVIFLITDNEIEEIPVNIGLKKTICVDFSDVCTLNTNFIKSDHLTRIIISGTLSEIKSFKKTEVYKTLSKKSKIIFKNKSETLQLDKNTGVKSFNDVCTSEINKETNCQVLINLFTNICK